MKGSGESKSSRKAGALSSARSLQDGSETEIPVSSRISKSLSPVLGGVAGSDFSLPRQSSRVRDPDYLLTTSDGGSDPRALKLDTSHQSMRKVLDDELSLSTSRSAHAADGLTSARGLYGSASLGVLDSEKISPRPRVTPLKGQLGPVMGLHSHRESFLNQTPMSVEEREKETDAAIARIVSTGRRRSKKLCPIDQDSLAQAFDPRTAMGKSGKTRKSLSSSALRITPRETENAFGHEGEPIPRTVSSPTVVPESPELPTELGVGFMLGDSQPGSREHASSDEWASVGGRPKRASVSKLKLEPLSSPGRPSQIKTAQEDGTAFGLVKTAREDKLSELTDMQSARKSPSRMRPLAGATPKTYVSTSPKNMISPKGMPQKSCREFMVSSDVTMDNALQRFETGEDFPGAGKTWGSMGLALEDNNDLTDAAQHTEPLKVKSGSLSSRDTLQTEQLPASVVVTQKKKRVSYSEAQDSVIDVKQKEHKGTKKPELPHLSQDLSSITSSPLSSPSNSPYDDHMLLRAGRSPTASFIGQVIDEAEECDVSAPGYNLQPLAALPISPSHTKDGFWGSSAKNLKTPKGAQMKHDTMTLDSPCGTARVVPRFGSRGREESMESCMMQVPIQAIMKDFYRSGPKHKPALVPSLGRLSTNMKPGAPIQVQQVCTSRTKERTNDNFTLVVSEGCVPLILMPGPENHVSAGPSHALPSARGQALFSSRAKPNRAPCELVFIPDPTNTSRPQLITARVSAAAMNTSRQNGHTDGVIIPRTQRGRIETGAGEDKGVMRPVTARPQQSLSPNVLQRRTARRGEPIKTARSARGRCLSGDGDVEQEEDDPPLPSARPCPIEDEHVVPSFCMMHTSRGVEANGFMITARGRNTAREPPRIMTSRSGGHITMPSARMTKTALKTARTGRIRIPSYRDSEDPEKPLTIRYIPMPIADQTFALATARRPRRPMALHEETTYTVTVGGKEPPQILTSRISAPSTARRPAAQTLLKTARSSRSRFFELDTELRPGPGHNEEACSPQPISDESSDESLERYQKRDVSESSRPTVPPLFIVEDCDGGVRIFTSRCSSSGRLGSSASTPLLTGARTTRERAHSFCSSFDRAEASSVTCKPKPISASEPYLNKVVYSQKPQVAVPRLAFTLTGCLGSQDTIQIVTARGAEVKTARTARVNPPVALPTARTTRERLGSFIGYVGADEEEEQPVATSPAPIADHATAFSLVLVKPTDDPVTEHEFCVTSRRGELPKILTSRVMRTSRKLTESDDVSMPLRTARSMQLLRSHRSRNDTGDSSLSNSDSEYNGPPAFCRTPKAQASLGAEEEKGKGRSASPPSARLFPKESLTIHLKRGSPLCTDHKLPLEKLNENSATTLDATPLFTQRDRPFLPGIKARDEETATGESILLKQPSTSRRTARVVSFSDHDVQPPRTARFSQKEGSEGPDESSGGGTRRHLLSTGRSREISPVILKSTPEGDQAGVPARATQRSLSPRQASKPLSSARHQL